MPPENQPATQTAPAASAAPAAAAPVTTAAPAAAAPADTTLATSSTDAAAAQKIADDQKELERVAALTPEARQAEQTAKAKVESEAATKAEETRRAALTPEARKAEDEAKALKDAEAKANAVPDKYELKLPDGLKIDAAVQTAFEAKAKELGLSQDKAQALYDIGAQAIQSNAKAQATQAADTQASWLEASRADKEFGGDALQANMAVAAKAMGFATPELKTILNDTKLGNHPEVIRWMVRVGKAMSEDAHRQGREALKNTQTFTGKAQAFYPGMNP